jgi:hypothetical protein
MATNNSVNVTLSGQSGTGSFAGTTSPTLVTPTLGAASATSINFGGNSLSAYVVGSWTPIDSSGASLSFTSVSANYTQIGNMVFAYCQLIYPSTVNSSNSIIGGLPLTTVNTSYVQGGYIFGGSFPTGTRLQCTQNATTFFPVTAGGARITNVTLSTLQLNCIIIYSIA